MMRWIFKTAASVWLVSNTFDIVMAVFDLAQHIVAESSGIIAGNTHVNDVGLSMLEASMMNMEVGPLFGLFLQSFFIGITMRILSIVIFVIVYGRMVESIWPSAWRRCPCPPLAAGSRARSARTTCAACWPWGSRGFWLVICVAIYAVLIENVAISGDAIGSIWSIVGYTVLLCFTLFKTSAVARSILNAH